jgi:pseudaminic acid cytidylyltransferase
LGIKGKAAAPLKKEHSPLISMKYPRRIAVIPARGGSKRIPRKNIREFCGKPIIAWSIEAARASALFDKVVVSTDDAQIAEVAASYGAAAPFVRPPELSDDHAGTTEVIAHATRWAMERSWPVDAVCCIYATAPLIAAEDLSRGLVALESGDWHYAFSATEFAASIFRAMRMTPQGGVEMIFPEYFPVRSQDLPFALHDAAQFYWGTAAAWLERAPIFAGHSVPVLIPRSRSRDIDSPEDWALAESLFKISTTRPERP